MDADRFDALARSVVATGSRRGALRLLAGGLLAAPLSLLGRREAAAACRARGRICSARDQCCGAGGGRVACQKLRSGCGKTGRRCCGLANAVCDPRLADCDCCGELRCGRLDPAATKDRCFACKQEGAPCSATLDDFGSDPTCCSGLCVAAGECAPDGSTSCTNNGGCSKDTDCCAGRLCVGGSCQPISA